MSTKLLAVTTPPTGPFQQSLITATNAGGSPGAVVLTNSSGMIDPSLVTQVSAGGGFEPFTWYQNTPSTSWIIPHNLNTYPSVTVTDSSGNWVIGGIQFNSLNQVTLTFSAAFSGIAVLV